MPAPHAFYSKMLAERTVSRNVVVLFYFILLHMILVLASSSHTKFVTYQSQKQDNDNDTLPTYPHCRSPLS